jgi:hypothetical protein
MRPADTRVPLPASCQKCASCQLVYEPSPLIRCPVSQVCFNVDVPLGGLEGPIKTQFGYHLIQVVKRSEA